MKWLLIYGCILFVGLPLVLFSTHVATLPEDAKTDLSEAAKDFNGRIYNARIICRGGRGEREHVMRVHGRSREDARQKIERQLKRCNVEILDGESAPIWQEALRSIY